MAKGWLLIKKNERKVNKRSARKVSEFESEKKVGL